MDKTYSEDVRVTEDDRCPQRGSWRKVTPVGWKQGDNAYRPIEGSDRWINLDHATNLFRGKGRDYTVITMLGEGEISVAELPWQIIGEGERGKHGE